MYITQATQREVHTATAAALSPVGQSVRVVGVRQRGSGDVSPREPRGQPDSDRGCAVGLVVGRPLGLLQPLRRSSEMRRSSVAGGREGQGVVGREPSPKTRNAYYVKSTY